MAVQTGRGSLDMVSQNIADVSNVINPSNVLMSSRGFGETPKPPISAAKTGISFVIPKNKLSGSLVPVARNVAGKWESADVKKEGDPKCLTGQRKTKWGIDLTLDPAVKRGRALALQTRAEQIAAQLESGLLDIDSNEATRSPSPPPIYDFNGQRTNTREGRRREQLELERREAIGDCLQLNPFYKPPSGYKPVYKEAKLYIPVKDYPGYNFIGLILGPRGNTQKRMEAETGSKIAIRGKGAVKEGKKSNAARIQGGRRDGKEAEGEFADLHVHITADSIEKVDAAVALVEPLLTPVDEDINTHKRKQLRELAEMNGTMRDFSKACGICGEAGHREWHCSKDKLVTFQAKVDCQVCGDGGHPTIDCPRKLAGQGKVLEKEYLSFLEELGDGLVGPCAVSTPGLSTKAAKEESTQKSGQPGVITSPASLTTEVISETSLDPNQLVDVISRPHSIIMSLNQLQHMPPAWAPVHAFSINSEARTLQEVAHAQSVSDRQLSGFQRHEEHGFNVPSGKITLSGFSHPSGHSLYQGHSPSVMDLNMGGLSTEKKFQVPSSGICASDGVPSNSDSSGGMLRPCLMQTYNNVPPATFQTQATQWNQRINSPAVATDAPMIWESNQHLQTQTAWQSSLSSQQPLPPWQTVLEQNLKEEFSFMPPVSKGQSQLPPWGLTQKSRKVDVPWNAPSIPPAPSHPWPLPQRPLHLYPPKPTALTPVPGAFIWRSGPACQSTRMPSSFLPLPPPPPQNPSSQPNMSPLHPFSPWQSYGQPKAEPNTFIKHVLASQMNQLSVPFSSRPSTTTNWAQQLGGKSSLPELHALPAQAVRAEKEGKLSQSKVVINPASTTICDTSNTQQNVKCLWYIA